MNCAGKIQALRTLEIVSVVKSEAGPCMVDAQLSASHDIEITNWGGRMFIVDIHGECQTPCIRYLGTGGPHQTWDQKSLIVQSCPGSGGPPQKAAASQPLTSLGARRAQSIRTDLTWVAWGWPDSSRTESLGAQVETLR
jgi:hypothetical protein